MVIASEITDSLEGYSLSLSGEHRYLFAFVLMCLCQILKEYVGYDMISKSLLCTGTFPNT